METTCYHCGDALNGSKLKKDDHPFCCNGCLMVYSLLSQNELGTYYQLERQPGVKPNDQGNDRFDYLNLPEIQEKLVDFADETTIKSTLFLPQIHCSSCIYLLENLHKLHEGIVSSQVNFTRKEAILHFNPQKISFSEVAVLLDKIGYTPNFSAKDKARKSLNKTLFYQLGIAGFAFGSIMLWSFPEYLGIDQVYADFRDFSAYLSFAVSVPVLLYSAKDYFISAYKALRFKSLNLDVPITIGILVLYIKSSWAIFSQEGPGYMDSFAGFIFFLLIGKWFQNKTYQALSFERDYKSYFPVAVIKINANNETSFVEIDQLQIGETFRIRNEEIIPCDSVLLSNEAHIDYSFVTGESVPITKRKGDLIYAGGKQIGSSIDLEVKKHSSRSHLTQLWDNSSGRHKETTSLATQDKVSVYFIVIELIIAVVSSIGWAFIDPSRIPEIITAILIVACPCALALSVPFTFGNIMRSLGRMGLYLRNVAVIEGINDCTDIVFDKTGTLTTGSAGKVTWEGNSLTPVEKQLLYYATASSTHPLSQGIHSYFQGELGTEVRAMDSYAERSGKGIEATWSNQTLQLGSAAFLGLEIAHEETAVFVAINGTYKGKFTFTAELRPGVDTLVTRLASSYRIHVISGDSNRDEETLRSLFPANTEFRFQQSPLTKKEYIQELRARGRNVMMIGDGLNDSGALMEAHVGIAVSENIFRFTPSSDAIIEATSLYRLDRLISLSHYAKTVLKICLGFSLTYNIIGLSFAIGGQLTPLVAAILMPLSSITVVLISTLFVRIKKA